MRLSAVIPLVLLIGCSSTRTPHPAPNPEGRIVEDAILWQAELDPVT